jgi:preprotein translocase subunit SecD
MRAKRLRPAARVMLSVLVLGLALACSDSGGGPERAAPPAGARCDDAGSAGGVEIVLAPVETADGGQLAAAADAVCRRVANLTDTAEVTVVDGTVVARLGGVADAEHARALLARGTLRFRPVLAVDPAGVGPAPTPPEGDVPDQQVVLADDAEQVYTLGPTAMSGEVVERAFAVPGAPELVESAEDVSQAGRPWAVGLVLRPGTDGIDTFNAVAALCYSVAPTCPTGQLAVTIDSRVLSAPMITEPSYRRDQIQVSGGFDEAEATDLAMMLGAGRLPIALQVASSGTYG